jgi:hypothetical protein
MRPRHSNDDASRDSGDRKSGFGAMGDLSLVRTPCPTGVGEKVRGLVVRRAYC